MTDVIRNIADTVTEVDVFADGDYKPVEVPAAVVVKTIADEEPYVNDMATEPSVKMEEVRRFSFCRSSIRTIQNRVGFFILLHAESRTRTLTVSVVKCSKRRVVGAGRPTGTRSAQRGVRYP